MSPDTWPCRGWKGVRGQEPDAGQCGVRAGWTGRAGREGSYPAPLAPTNARRRVPRTPLGTPRASRRISRLIRHPVRRGHAGGRWSRDQGGGGTAPHAPRRLRSSPSSRAQRVRRGPAPSGCSGKPPVCFLPACLPSNSSPGTLAASSETRPVFLAHIFLLLHCPWCNSTPRRQHGGVCRRGARISSVPALRPKAGGETGVGGGMRMD